jgi:hypothetical protein
VVLLSRWDEHPTLMKAAPVWPTSHHNESLQQQAIPIQNNEWSVLKLHVKRNLQIIQSLESFEPDSSAARAVFEACKLEADAAQQKRLMIFEKSFATEDFLPRV